MKIYTFGYQGQSLPALVAKLEALDAILVDIRLSPRSRIWAWTHYSLMHELPGRYRWIQCLGNRNYKGGSIEIADLERGLVAVEELIAMGRTVVLLCVCKSPRTCHRTVVAAALRARGHTVEELSL